MVYMYGRPLGAGSVKAIGTMIGDVKVTSIYAANWVGSNRDLRGCTLDNLSTLSKLEGVEGCLGHVSD